MLGGFILDRKQGRTAMNILADSNVPFFFMVDAWNKNWIVLKLEEAGNLGIQWSLNRNNPLAAQRNLPKTFRFEPVDFLTYQAAFNVIRQGQINGDTWLANLTFPARLTTDITLHDMYVYASAAFRLHIPNTLTVFSPERFVKIDSDGCITSHPMKGTISLKGLDSAEAEKAILADTKETAEHVTIVDLIRNDLGMVSDWVEVPRFRYMTEVDTGGGNRLLQVSSEVAGRLVSGWQSRLGSILDTLLPAGSVTGAPKKRTCELIRSAEKLSAGNERGWYTGVFGCFDGRTLDSAVAIRFVRQDEQGCFYYHSGGGITIYSDPYKEYDELQRKIYAPFA